MKNLITILTFLISIPIFANDVWGEIVSIPNKSIEAVISKSGIYVRLIDLQDGEEYFNGVIVGHDRTFLLQI